MALLYGARQLLGKMAAATAAKPQRGIERAADVELLKPVGPLQMTRLSAGFAPFVVSVPQDCLDTPSKMSRSERQFLFGLARRYYTGQGLIVDAGIFLADRRAASAKACARIPGGKKSSGTGRGRSFRMSERS